MRPHERFGFGGAWAVGLWVALGGVAAAGPIPVAAFNEIAEVKGPPPTLQTFDACSPDGCLGVGSVTRGSTAFGAVASASVVSTASTPLSLSVSASSVGTTYAQGAADAIYYFEWSGPAGLVASIPTFIDLTFSVTASGDASDSHSRAAGSAYLDVTTNGAEVNPSTPFPLIACYNGGGYINNGNYHICDSADLSRTAIYNLSPGVLYSLELNAFASTSGLNGIAEIAATTAMSATAFADPRIYLDPTYSNTGGYQLLLSDGIDNGVGGPTDGGSGQVPIPEPGTVSLLGSALGALALRRRNARR